MKRYFYLGITSGTVQSTKVTGVVVFAKLEYAYNHDIPRLKYEPIKYGILGQSFI